MEHLVQFGVSVDDKRIEDAVIKAAADEVVKAFKSDSYYSRNVSAEYIIENCVNKKLDELKDEIIKEAGFQLAEALKRTKVVKETVKKIVNEEME